MHATTKAPPGLCAHHRTVWRLRRRHNRPRLMSFVSAYCLSGRSTRCSREHESAR